MKSNETGSGLAFLTRPEGALLVLCLCVQDLRSKSYRSAAIGAAAFVLTALAVGLVMRSVYGHMLPNSFYVKQHQRLTPGSFRRLSFIL